MNESIREAFTALSNAIDAFDVEASITDDDVSIWNKVIQTKNELRKQIEAQL